MKRLVGVNMTFALALIVLNFTGCATDSKIDQGPDGTVAYNVPIDSSQPGRRLEVNGESVGVTPVVLKVFGDRDGTFHNFGSADFMVIAHSVNSSEVRTTNFHTGTAGEKDDKIPDKIYFDFGSPANSSPR
jgi:hypothetical protein